MNCFVCNFPFGPDDRGLLCGSCTRLDAEKQRRAKLTPEERRYEDELGREAMERQRTLAKDHFVCCGEHVDAGHHEACPKRPADVLPVVIEGQAVLA